MDRWLDPTQIEAWLRNWLIVLGKETGLPFAGRDWEFLALALIALIAAWIWFWPSRRAFRAPSPLRWLVLGLNLMAIPVWSFATWPIWIIAMLLSSIRRSVPQPAAKPLGPGAGVAATRLIAAIRKLAEASKKTAVPMPKAGGPWGKGKASPSTGHVPSASGAIAAEKSQAATAALTAAAAVGHALSHGLGDHRRSVRPDRATWIRRRG